MKRVYFLNVIWCVPWKVPGTFYCKLFFAKPLIDSSCYFCVVFMYNFGYVETSLCCICFIKDFYQMCKNARAFCNNVNSWLNLAIKIFKMFFTCLVLVNNFNWIIHLYMPWSAINFQMFKIFMFTWLSREKYAFIEI